MSKNGTQELPPGWVDVALEDFCLIIQGQSPPGETYNTTREGLPFFQGKAEFGNIYPIPIKWCSAPTKIAEPDNILVSIRAPVGPTNLNPTVSCIGRGLAAIRPLDVIPPRYVLYGLRSTEDNLASKGTGSTFAAISGSDLRAHRLPLAPLPEQHRIVAEIEKQFTRLDTAVAALKRTQANLKRYRASVLKAACEGRLVPTEAELAHAEGRDYEPADRLLARILTERRTKWEADQLAKMQAQGKTPKDDKWKEKYQEPVAPDTADLPELPEGWVITSMDQLTVHITSGSRDWSKYYGRGQGVFLMAQNVRPGRLDLTYRQLVDPPKDDRDRVRSQVREDDLLVTIVGANTGDVCRVSKELDEHFVCQSVALMRPIDSRISLFLEIYMTSEENGQRQYRRYIYGAGRPHLSFDQLKMTLILFPPLAEQHRIVIEVERRLSILDELETTVNANLKRAERLRQSILKRAFEGKLVPQDLNDEPASVLLERIRTERVGAHGRAPLRAGHNSSTTGRAPLQTGGKKRNSRVSDAQAELFRSAPCGRPTPGHPHRGAPTSRTSERT